MAAKKLLHTDGFQFDVNIKDAILPLIGQESLLTGENS